MRRVVSFVRVLSLLFFLGALLFVYAYLPENVSLYSDGLGTPVFYIGKSQFFYFAFAFFVLVNLMLFILTKVLAGVRVTPGKGIFSSEPFKENTLIWIEVLISIVNIFFTTGAAFIGIYNDRTAFELSNFTYLVYIGIILLIGWILSYVFVLRYRAYQPS